MKKFLTFTLCALLTLSAFAQRDVAVRKINAPAKSELVKRVQPNQHKARRKAGGAALIASATEVTVSEALSIANGLTPGAETDGYYKATVTLSKVSTALSNIPGKYTNINCTVEDNTGSIACYYTNYLDNEPFSSAEQVPAVGTKLVIVGKLKLFKGSSSNTPEFVNGFIAEIVGEAPTAEEIIASAEEITVEEAIAKANALASGAYSDKYYIVYGTLSDVMTAAENVPSKYTNINCKIQDETGTIASYYTNYIDNEPFSSSDQVPEAGAEVAIVGKLTNFQGKTPEFSNGFFAYIEGGSSSEGAFDDEPETPTQITGVEFNEMEGYYTENDLYEYETVELVFNSEKGEQIYLLGYRDLNASVNGLPAGDYTIMEDDEVSFDFFVASTGYDSDENYYEPSYFVDSEDNIYFLESGTVTVSYDGEGNVTIQFNATSHFGSTISGTYSGELVLDEAQDDPYEYEGPVGEFTLNVNTIEIEGLKNYNGEIYSWVDFGCANGDTLFALVDFPSDFSGTKLPLGEYPVYEYGYSPVEQYLESGYLDEEGYFAGTFMQTADVQYYFVVDGKLTVSEIDGVYTVSGDLTTGHGSIIHISYSEGSSTGLRNVSATELGAYVQNGYIYFNANAGEQVRLFDATGRIIANMIAKDGINSVEASQGIVLLNVNGKIAKLVVK